MTKARAGGAARPRPQSGGGAARMPFVLLVVALLAGGLISLLLLNSALNEGSFQLSRLKKETTALTDEQQALQRDVDAYSAPDALQRRARELGMVPGGSPVFLGPEGRTAGTPAPAEAPAPPPAPPAPPSPAPGSPAPSAQAPAPGQAPAPSGTPQPTPTPGR
ncbi:septum formation initiator family protein [Streptomyces sp. NPDC127110]|uniref:FtsB family cell division protein n=1 Tax=Streptomyces sp. NPDC127110 TaxID=3345362 RepID=UPI00363EC3BD